MHEVHSSVKEFYSSRVTAVGKQAGHLLRFLSESRLQRF